MADVFEPRFADLVRIYTTTQGTDDFIIGAAVTGFRSFNSALKIGDHFYYCAVHSDRPSEREVGRGMLRADGKISREAVNGMPTSFSAGTKTIALVAAAEWYDTVKVAVADAAVNANASADAAAASANAAADSAAASVADVRGALTYTADAANAVDRPFLSKLRDVLSAKDFGAVGDGATNDDAALSLAFQVAADTGIPLHIPAGTYMVDRAMFVMVAVGSDRFVVRGDGAATVLKMRDGQISADNSKMFSIQPSSDLAFVEISNLVIDMNARGSPVPADPYAYQHSHAIAVEPRAGVTIGHCRFHGVTIKDPAGDGINFGPNATAVVGTAQISDFLEIDRTRTRASIECSRLPNSLIVTGAKCNRIECETLSGSASAKRISIANSEIELLDMLEDSAADPTMVHVNLDNVTVATATDFYNVRIKASNCRFRIDGGGIFQNLYKSDFTGCTFVHAFDPAANAINGLNPFWLSTRTSPATIAFNACKFLIDSDDTAILPTGYLVNPSTVTSVANLGKSSLTFNDCMFDPRAQGSVCCNRNGTWALNNCTFGGSQAAVFYGVTSGQAIDVTINGGNFAKVTGAAVRGTWLALDQAATVGWLRTTGDWIGVAVPVTSNSGTITSADNQLVNSRRMQVAALPAAALRGDTIRVQPTLGKPHEYVCTTSSTSAPVLRFTRQTVDKGPTAARPALGQNDAGALYFDTSLAAAGKPISWTGAAWVDSSGAAA